MFWRVPEGTFPILCSAWIFHFCTESLFILVMCIGFKISNCSSWCIFLKFIYITRPEFTLIPKSILLCVVNLHWGCLSYTAILIALSSKHHLGNRKHWSVVFITITWPFATNVPYGRSKSAPFANRSRWFMCSLLFGDLISYLVFVFSLCVFCYACLVMLSCLGVSCSGCSNRNQICFVKLTDMLLHLIFRSNTVVWFIYLCDIHKAPPLTPWFFCIIFVFLSSYFSFFLSLSKIISRA